MPAARRAGPVPCHHTSINDLPDPLLAHIFSFLERRDSLSVLLVSKAWFSVAGEHCGALWDGLCVDGDRVCLEGAVAKKCFQSGFRKRASNMSTLRVLGRKEAFILLLPSLLQTLLQCGGSSRLQELDLQVAFWKLQHYTACCKVVGQLTALRRLKLIIEEDEDVTGRRADYLPLTPLLQLSSLSCLESLEVLLPDDVDDAQAVRTLLPSLASLTQLAWNIPGWPPGELMLCWQRPDGSGPSIRDLRLFRCSVGTPEGAAAGGDLLLRSLQHVERLVLQHAVPTALEQLAEVLPQLPGLTSLMLNGLEEPPEVEQRVLQAALLCPHLQELDLAPKLGGLPLLLPRAVPPGALQQLTKLVVEGSHSHVPPAWKLPQLKHLHVYLEDYAPLGAAGMQALALNPSLEELLLRGNVSISQATRAISELVCLTRLSINTWSTDLAELHVGPYLAGLKELALHQRCDDACHALLPAIVHATALTQLDLTGDWGLALEEQDVHLLAKLPSLKTVRLPVPGPGEEERVSEAHMKRNAAVVAHMQEVLCQAGVSVEAVPLWQVNEWGSRVFRFF